MDSWLIFPPALLASAAVGGHRSGRCGLLSHAQKAAIKADVEDILPLNSPGILAMFEPHWADAIDTALSGASKVRKEQVDADSAGESRPRPRRTRRLRPRSAGSSPTVLAPDPQLGWGQQGR